SARVGTEVLRPPAARPELLAITKTAAAVGVAEATTPSHSDSAGESALSDARDTFSRMRARRVSRWRLAIALAAVAGVGVGGPLARANKQNTPPTVRRARH